MCLRNMFGKIKNPESSVFTKGKGRKRTEVSDMMQRGSERQEKCGEEACHEEAAKTSSVRPRRVLHSIDTGWAMRVFSGRS